MRSSPQTAPLLLLLPLALLVRTTHAVALCDFTPAASNLPAACNVIYTAPIPDCQTSDFTSSSNICSAACVAGLQAIGAQLVHACSFDDVKGQGDNLVWRFLESKGVQALCANVAVSTTIMLPPSISTSTPRTARTTAITVTPSIGSGTLVLSSVAATSNGLLFDTSSQPSVSSAASTSSIPLVVSTSAASTTPTSTATVTVVLTASPTTASTLASTHSSAVGASTHTSGAAQTTVKTATSASTSAVPPSTSTSRAGGGGSPFDNAGSSSGASIRFPSVVLSVLAAVGACYTVF
ncbi:hypothetical protein B0A49_06357 [Cryomyces minteri]|uniref:Extracellular membrane protein CFEM domain-containing protein n=1 Tax=Cryomyces minteri TaxID=331657 RepID=A0A4V5NF88_9PEZI|nr:hypothetical protein B0A49_06357 [Cryomyces minteri]